MHVPTDLYSLPKDILISLFTSLEADITERVSNRFKTEIKRLKKERDFLQFHIDNSGWEGSIFACVVEDCTAKYIDSGRWSRVENCDQIFTCKICDKDFCDKHISCELCNDGLEHVWSTNIDSGRWSRVENCDQIFTCKICDKDFCDKHISCELCNDGLEHVWSTNI
jgi:hypothetical protein